jgi:D-alanyl-D-alanine endopeptidase (penicillin-binding protein 7)
MIAKALAQIIFAGTLLQFFPADLSALQQPLSSTADYSLSTLAATLPTAAMRENYPVKVDVNSYGIVTSAKSAMVMDAKSGMVLLAKNPDQVRSIGSVTKLMTAIVFLEAQPDLTQSVTLDAERDLVTGGRIYLAFNDPLTLEEVFAAAMVGSDNTAANSLVRFSGLSTEEFIARMNAKAQELGMAESTFADPTGINTYNLSTARDLVKLLAFASTFEPIKKYSTLAKLSVTHQSGREVLIDNTDGLLGGYLDQAPYDIIAGKTGYLPQAGYLLTTAVAKDDHEIYVLVMGANSKEERELEVKGLANWAFSTFRWPGEDSL